MADVTVNTSGFDDAPRRFARALNKTLRTWAFEVERRAKKKSPVDTGFNKNSIYTVTPDGKLMADGKQISTRPGDPNAPSTKGRKKYKPGQFADMAPIDTGGGYQDTLAAFGQAGGSSFTMLGGAERMGPGRADAPDTLAAEVRVGSEYGIYLEMGTYRMEPRPFLGPAAAEVTPMVDNLMRKNLKGEGLL